MHELKWIPLMRPNCLIFRWHVSATHQLPEYMRLCYEALLDVYDMIEKEMAKQGRSYAVDYAKSTVSFAGSFLIYLIERPLINVEVKFLR